MATPASIVTRPEFMTSRPTRGARERTCPTCAALWRQVTTVPMARSIWSVVTTPDLWTALSRRLGNTTRWQTVSPLKRRFRIRQVAWRLALLMAANTWTAKANMPGSNNNVRGSGVALDNLWVFGGGNPFGPTASTKAAFARERVKGQLVPNTTNGAVRYDPATDTWSTAPNMNVQRAFTSGAAISAKLIAAGGYDGSFTVASAETLDACIPEPTPTPCDSGVIINGGFETGSFGSEWVIDGTNNPPLVNTTNPHSGTFAAAAGDFGPFPAPEPSGDSSFYQQFTVPATGGTLSFWHWDYTTDSITFDWQDAYITDSSGNILQTIFHQC